MPRRLIVPLLSFAVILTAAVAPATPWVRDALLERVRAPLAAAGWTVTWEASGGNAWRGVTLRDVTVDGPRATATLARLEVAWFLPGLATGAAPIDVRAAGVEADVTLPAGGGAGAPLDLRRFLDRDALPRAVRWVRLRDVAVRDASVAIGGAPFALPDVRLADLTLRDAGGRVSAGATLVGPADADDAGRVQVTVGADGTSVDVQADRLPAAWAEVYVPGVTGGRIDADVRYRAADGWSGSARLEGGRWRPAGVPDVAAVRDVAATADLEGGLVTLDASGRADAGAILASADVDLTLRRLTADVRTAGRIEDALPAPVRDALGPAWTPSGTTFVEAEIRGWRDLRVDARARLEGRWNDRPAVLRSDDLTFRAQEGWSGALRGRLLEGPTTVTVAGRGVPQVRARVAGARLAGATVDATADLLGVAPLDATWTVEVDGGADGPLAAATASLQGTHGPRGATIEARVEGGAVTGAGAWRVEGDGVEGGATLRVAGADDAGGDGRIAVRTDGAWDALSVEVRSDADAPWRPAWRGVRLDADARGVVRARVRDGALAALEGAWGPLRLASSEGGVRLALDPTGVRVADADVARVAVPALNLARDDGTWRVRGDVRVEGGGGLPADVAPWDLRVAADAPADAPFRPAAWTASALGTHGGVTWRDAHLDVRLDAWPWTWAVAGVREAGAVNVRADVGPDGPPSGSLVWRPAADAALAPLRATFEGTEDGGRTTLRAGPLRASLDGRGASVGGDGDLGSLHPALGGWTVDGALTRAADGWDGALRVGREEDGDALTLAASDGGLEVDADATLAGVGARATGPVWPTTDVRIEAGRPTDAADVRLRVGGPDEPFGPDLPLAGRASWRDVAWGPYRVAAGEVRFGGRLAAPEVVGPTGRAMRLEDGVVTGGLVVRADVAGRPHTVRIAADGPPADPDVRLAVDGGVLTIRADRAPGRAELAVQANVGPDGWPDALAPVAPGDARVTGALAANGAWRLAVRGDVAPLDRPAQLALDGEGVGREATATWRVATPDGRDLVAGRVAWEDGVATLALNGDRSDPAALGRWGDWRLDGTARGEAVLTVGGATPPTLALRGDARLDGTLAGRPLEVALDGAGGGRARYADTRLVWPSGDGRSLRVTAPGASLDATLEAGPRAVLAGTLGERTVTGAVAWGDGEARADLRTGSARADVRVALAPDGWTAALRARDAAAPWSLAATVEGTDGGVTLRRLASTVAADGLPGTLEGTAEGPLWPRLDVRGRADVAGVDGVPSVAIGVRGGWPRTTWRATLPGLSLQADADAFTLAGLTLAGPGGRVGDLAVTPRSGGLRWTPDGGYAGGADLTYAPSAGPSVRADVRGDGVLRATLAADVAPAGATLRATSDVRIVGAPWAATLAGDGRVDAAVAGGAAELAADLTWSGRLPAPRLTATGVLSGVADADVRADAAVGADGATLDAQIVGDGLDLVARADSGGATLRGDVRDVPLPAAWTAGRTVRLSADLEARSGAAPGTPLGTLALRGDGVAWEGAWRAGAVGTLAGDLRLDVAALSGGAASGVVAGPLAMDLPPDAGPHLDADLDVANVAWRDASARGTVRVAGPASAPRVTTDLTVAGPVAGPATLTADVAAGTASWRSEVRTPDGAPWAVGTLAWSPDGGGVVGTLATADGEVRGGTQDGRPAVIGAGRWAGLRVAVAGDAPDPQLEVVLPLAALTSGVGGTLEAAVRPTPGAAWLDGVVRRPSVAGAPLPDATLRGRAGDLRVDLGGRPALAVDLQDGRWRATVADLPLAPDGATVQLDATGAGRGGQGDLEVRVRGSGDDDVSLALARDAEGTRVAVSGTWAGGRVGGTATRRDGRWSGGPTLRDLPTPWGVASADVALHGGGALPDGTLDAHLARPEPVTARATWAWPADGGPPAVDVALDAARAQLAGPVWPTLDVRVAGDAGTAAHLTGGPDAPWRVAGRADVPVGPVLVRLGGDGDGVPRLDVRPRAAPDATLRVDLPDAPPAPAIARLLREGRVAYGVDALAGEVAWTPGAPLAVRNLTWVASVGTVQADGTLAADGSDLRGRLTPRRDADATLAARLADELAGGTDLPWRLQGSAGDATLTLGSGREAPEGALRGTVAWRDAVLEADLVGAGVRLDARATPGDGIRGEATLDGVRLTLPGAVAARLEGTLTADGRTLAGRLAATGPGRLQADGALDLAPWLPAAYRPPTDGTTSGRPPSTAVTVRLANVDVGRLPVVARTLPHLEGDLAATVRIDGRRVIAQAAAPDLRVADAPLPLRLDGIGELGTDARGVTLGGALAGSPVQLALSGEGADLLVRMERFPLTTPLEAWLGALETRSEATGVLRATLPWATPAAGELRVATERVRLSRGGVRSVGTLTGRVARDGATLDAAFEGDGRWSLALGVDGDTLDAAFRATDADAAPLVGLVPALARVGAGVRGDLTLDAQGPLRAPDVDVTTDDLEVVLAGSAYRLRDAHLAARDGDVRVDAILTGSRPLGGRLEIGGDARATLVPWRLERAGLDVRGDLRVPVIGTIRDVDGRIGAGPEGRPTLEARGVLGTPARFEGTLWPFDLRARGDDLRLAAPSVWVADAVGDADVRLRFDERFVLSGGVAIREGRFDLGARAAATAAPSPTDAAASAAPSDAADAAPAPPSGGGSAFAFEAFEVRADTVAFDEGFGSGTARVALTLGGTTARPTLDGVAEIVRGNLDLSGRSFEVREGTVRFDPTRGVYPRITVAADATFDPRDALAGAARDVRLVEPARGPFTVALAFDAVATGDGPGGFALALDPTLASDAILEVPRADGRGTVTRPPTDGELAALVTTGRLDPTGVGTGANAASSVATTVLDNAVSLLVLDGLQDAFGEALGVDRVRIRTSSVGRALGEDADPFGVSLEVGGYLGDGVFASYEVGRFAGGVAGEALANRLAVTYDLGPVAVDLSTRLAFPGPGDVDPDQRVGAAVRYEVAPGLAVEGSASLGSFESEARFGVTLRW